MSASEDIPRPTPIAEPDPAPPARTREGFESCACPLPDQMISRAVSPSRRAHPPQLQSVKSVMSGQQACLATLFTLAKLSHPCNYVDTLATLSYPCSVVLPAPAQSLIVGPRSRGKRELNERSNLGHVH